MSFDPYLNWLGIPPHEQPPNFYRLLGVVLLSRTRKLSSKRPIINRYGWAPTKGDHRARCASNC